MKTILFDFDGVLVDSFQTSFEIHQTIQPGVAPDDYRKMLEGNLYDGLREVYGEKLDDSVKAFYDLYLPKLFQLPAVNGIPDVIENLSKKYKLIIISSIDSQSIRQWLVKHSLIKYFTEIMGADIHKSKVEKFNIVFDKYGINANKCIMITDTLGDLREAEKVGVKCLAVTYGYHDEEILSKGNSVDLIRSPQEMIAKIEKYLGK